MLNMSKVGLKEDAHYKQGYATARKRFNGHKNPSPKIITPPSCRLGNPSREEYIERLRKYYAGYNTFWRAKGIDNAISDESLEDFINKPQLDLKPSNKQSSNRPYKKDDCLAFLEKQGLYTCFRVDKKIPGEVSQACITAQVAILQDEQQKQSPQLDAQQKSIQESSPVTVLMSSNAHTETPVMPENSEDPVAPMGILEQYNLLLNNLPPVDSLSQDIDNIFRQNDNFLLMSDVLDPFANTGMSAQPQIAADPDIVHPSSTSHKLN